MYNTKKHKGDILENIANTNELYFYTGENCAPCESMKGFVKEFCKKYNVKLVERSREKYAKEMCEVYLQSVPAFLFKKDGKNIRSKIGSIDKKEFEELFKTVFGKKETIWKT